MTKKEIIGDINGDGRVDKKDRSDAARLLASDVGKGIEPLSGKSGKVQATRDCTIAKNGEGVSFSYRFKAGEIKEVPAEHAEKLLKTGIINEAK